MSNTVNDNLQSIKSRMGWQIAAQVGTILTLAKIDSSIQHQTDFLGEELGKIQKININGFKDVETAINSLEYSLICGFEDVKFLLGSIDSKLGRLIGLVEFSGATKSTEKYRFALELYKQDFFDKAQIQFEKSIEENPLNLNSMVGLYLSKKNKSKKVDLDLLNTIIRLTDSDFTLHTNTTKEGKQASIKFFSNFVFNELIEAEKYEDIINYYDGELLPIAKSELNIRIKYVTAKIITGKDYHQDVRELIDEGNLFYLLCFTNYKKEKVFVNFIKTCSSIFKNFFQNHINIEFEKSELKIINCAKIIIENLCNETELLKFACVKKNGSNKVNLLNNFFAKAASAEEDYSNLLKKQNTIQLASKKLTNLKDLIFPNPKNKFFQDASKEISKTLQEIVGKFKSSSGGELEKSSKQIESDIELFKKSYPILPSESQSSAEEIQVIISAVNVSKKSINYEALFKPPKKQNNKIQSLKKAKQQILSILSNTIDSCEDSLIKMEKSLLKLGKNPENNNTYVASKQILHELFQLKESDDDIETKTKKFTELSKRAKKIADPESIKNNL